jgi:poly(3-hydroxybutyrate) depolymerase
MMRRRQVLLMLAFLAVAAPALAQDVSMVPVTVDPESIRLAMRIYKPAAAGAAPTLVFNHGSTGRGTDPSIITGDSGPGHFSTDGDACGQELR